MENPTTPRARECLGRWLCVWQTFEVCRNFKGFVVSLLYDRLRPRGLSVIMWLPKSVHRFSGGVSRLLKLWPLKTLNSGVPGTLRARRRSLSEGVWGSAASPEGCGEGWVGGLEIVKRTPALAAQVQVSTGLSESAGVDSGNSVDSLGYFCVLSPGRRGEQAPSRIRQQNARQ